MNKDDNYEEYEEYPEYEEGFVEEEDNITAVVVACAN